MNRGGTVIQLIEAVQPPLLGGVLFWAAGVKLFGRHGAEGARRTALAPLLGPARALPAYRLLGGVELIIGTLLVLTPAPTVAAVAATGLAACFLGYLVYARRVAPESSCGCLSSRGTDPVSWRSFARGGLLVLAGLLATQATGYWRELVVTRPLAPAALLAEAVAVVMLSPELDRSWLVPLRHFRERLPRPIFGRSGVVLLRSVQQLQESRAYRSVAGLLHSDVLEHWDEEEWRIVCYNARYQGRPATAAFAVPLLRYDPDAVRVALVDEFTGVTVLRATGIPEDSAGLRQDAADPRGEVAGVSAAAGQVHNPLR
jgi:hypothetical protein